MQSSLFQESDPIDQLAKKWSLQINKIQHAKEQALKYRLQFSNICEDGQFFTVDTSVVVFGSLARDEYTSGSDADWTLLIDGEADSDHLRISHKIASSIKSLFKIGRASCRERV